MIRRFRDDRGAAAIEYAIIGALIGIGLIGSLLTTKTSLSSIFGVAGTQMANGGAKAAVVPNLATSSSPRQPFWSGKGISTAPTVSTSGTKTVTSYTFNDGTTANYTVDSSTGNLSLYWYNPTPNSSGRPIAMNIQANSAGVSTFVGLYGYTTNGAYISDSYVSSPGATWSGNPPVPNRYDTTYYNASGPTSSAPNQPTGTFASPAADGYNDMKYFMDLAKQQ